MVDYDTHWRGVEKYHTGGNHKRVRAMTRAPPPARKATATLAGYCNQEGIDTLTRSASALASADAAGKERCRDIGPFLSAWPNILIISDSASYEALPGRIS